MHVHIGLILFLAFVSGDTYAQFWKKKKHKAETHNTVTQPTSLNPSYQKKEYAAKASSTQRSGKGPTYGLEQAYYERMEKVSKERKKTERLMEKPQYSDPLYFGHKRPPKKRKPSKMKFCKECGIRH